MKEKIMYLKNGSREEACVIFDEVKASIADFSKESVMLKGDMKNLKDNWSVYKIIK